MEPETNPAPPADSTQPLTQKDPYAHLRSSNHKRGRGKPFQRGHILGIHLPGKTTKVGRRVATDLVQELAGNVLLAKSPNGQGEARIVKILVAIADRAEAGDLDAAELLLNRFAGKVKPAEDAPSEGGRITIEWDGPPPPWAPRPILDAHAQQCATHADEPLKGVGGGHGAALPQDVIDAVVVEGPDVQS